LSAAFSGLPQFFDAVREFQQQRAAIFRHGTRPAGKRLGSRGHCRAHLLFGRLGHVHDDLSGRRIENPQIVALAGAQLSVNEQFRVHRRAS
jgi:hypothetical protein